MSLEVWALNALTNSMMLMPCWPSAGPTGGAGLAWPPGACSLMVVRTFFAKVITSAGRPAPRPNSSSASGLATLDLLHLVEADLDRCLAAKDRDKHLEAASVL